MVAVDVLSFSGVSQQKSQGVLHESPGIAAQEVTAFSSATTASAIFGIRAMARPPTTPRRTMGSPGLAAFLAATTSTAPFGADDASTEAGMAESAACDDEDTAAEMPKTARVTKDAIIFMDGSGYGLFFL